MIKERKNESFVVIGLVIREIFFKYSPCLGLDVGFSGFLGLVFIFGFYFLF